MPSQEFTTMGTQMTAARNDSGQAASFNSSAKTKLDNAKTNYDIVAQQITDLEANLAQCQSDLAAANAALAQCQSDLAECQNANVGPDAVDDTATVQQDTVLIIPAATLLANDTDPDSDPLTVTGVSNAINGAVSWNAVAQEVTFTPNAGFVGMACFDYSISDGQGGTDTATVHVTVTVTPPPEFIWPNEDPNIGSADPATLPLWTGGYQFSTAGQVIEGFKFQVPPGTAMRVLANNVTFKNCHITYDNFFCIDAEDFSGLRLEHVTMIGQGGNSPVLSGNNSTIIESDFSNAENGIVLQGGTHYVNHNYIHDLSNPDASVPHIDGVSVQGGQVNTEISDNYIEAWDTSCVFIKCDFGPISGTLVEHNKLFHRDASGGPGGGGACTYSITGPVGGTPTGTVYRDNILRRTGFAAYFSLNGTVVREGNTDALTGASVDNS